MVRHMPLNSLYGGGALSLGRAPQGIAVDAWTAIVLLFHDHEWEQAILQWALSTPCSLGLT